MHFNCEISKDPTEHCITGNVLGIFYRSADLDCEPDCSPAEVLVTFFVYGFLIRPTFDEIRTARRPKIIKNAI